MSSSLRYLLIVAALLGFVFIIYYIRKSKLVISDSLFWFFFSLIMILIAINPEITYAISKKIGFVSTSNLVFLCIISLLLLRVFQLDIRISELTTKLKNLAQDTAIAQSDLKKEATSGK
jgi:hypothetical protein